MYNLQSSPQANLGTHSLPQKKPLSVGNDHTFSELPFNLPSVSVNLSHLNMLSKWNDLCDWVLSLSMMFSGVCCSMYQYFMSFYCQIIFLCMDRSHLIYLVIKGWTFGSFPLFRYLSNNYEHLCASVLFFFFSFLVTLWHMEFPGQGSDPSHIFDLRHRCGKSRSITHCSRPGIKPSSQGCRATTDPIASQ